jgi:hypothetical protein
VFLSAPLQSCLLLHPIDATLFEYFVFVRHDSL